MRNNIGLVAVVVLFVFASERLFGNQAAGLLGMLAALACFFALVCLLSIHRSSG